jgi:hypothetical protein
LLAASAEWPYFVVKRKMSKNRKYHYYSFPEILGQAMVLLFVVASVTGMFRVIEQLTYFEQSTITKTSNTTDNVTSVSEYLNRGYIRASYTPTIKPVSLSRLLDPSPPVI